ncbi:MULTISPECIES: serine hydrolase domain-containing protein [Streptomyces]|uniref:serine hydrolase domain-containing protein n=1 Tax=Streptomyces TaxID=1883 RepID=UPI001673C2E6|nr:MULTISPECIES: serine hydrolase domain-containing protein [Streptomyces]MBK3526717.1 beta-lactamase family protein [Streptomyces sp. MBT70]GGR62400.1 esterase [Streptomyces eurythermus]
MANVQNAAVNGTVAEGFEPVREAFAENFARLGERGAAVAVYRDGHRVVNLWAGTRDIDGTAPWEPGTAQIVRSATKGVAAAALLLLHQRGELDLDAPVGAYWPEFKAAGKDRTRVWHLLAHRAGVPVLDRPLTPAEAVDPDLGAAAVAAQAPVWEPGTEHGYHAQTYSWLTGELLRRVTGRPVGEWVAEEMAGPVGADLWLGLPEAERARAGRVGRAETPETAGGLKTRPKRAVAEAYADPDSLTRRAFAAITPLPDENDPGYRAAALPASNGIATADGLARFYAALTGEVDGGTRLFTPDTMELARTERSAGPDRVLVVGTRFGLGYMLHGTASPLLSPGSFGHPGRGGALAFADPESGIAFGYVTNGFRASVTADPRAQALVRAVRTALA